MLHYIILYYDLLYLSERNFKTVPPKHGFDLVSTNSLLSVRKQICLPCFSTTEQTTDFNTERCRSIHAFFGL